MGTSAIILAVLQGLPALVAAIHAFMPGATTQDKINAAGAIATTGANTMASASKGGQANTMAVVTPVVNAVVPELVAEIEALTASPAPSNG